MRPIDADALIERIKYSFHPNERVSIETVTGCFLDETGCAPTIDVKPVVYGHWILEREPNGKPYCFHCSVCDDDFHYIGIKSVTDYCPLCGAKMYGWEENNND